jgi:hypothetical protein
MPATKLTNYELSLRTHERRSVLLNEAAKHGALDILEHLNKLKDINQWNPRALDIMLKDIEFLKCKMNFKKSSNQKPCGL